MINLFSNLHKRFDIQSSYCTSQGRLIAATKYLKKMSKVLWIFRYMRAGPGFSSVLLILLLPYIAATFSVNFVYLSLVICLLFKFP